VEAPDFESGEAACLPQAGAFRPAEINQQANWASTLACSEIFLVLPYLFCTSDQLFSNYQHATLRREHRSSALAHLPTSPPPASFMLKEIG
jgi:hypothetical protein